MLVLSADQYLFNLLACNDEKLLTGKSYKSRESALGGIAAVRVNAAVDARYERKTSARGEPYFVLRTADHEVIGTSEMYPSGWERDAGIEAVKVNAAAAVLEDRT